MDTSQSAAGSPQVASRKDRFDLCVGMLKAYYDALEGRLEKSVALLVVVVGWLVTSDKARAALAGVPVLFWCAVVTLTAVVALYCWNIVHWVRRFREVQASVDELKYVEHEYYTRYRFPSWVISTYLAPVLLLYAFAVGCLILVGLGRLQ